MNFSAAYRMACLNVTYEDWQALANFALSKCNLDIARKCLVQLADWHYLDLIDTHYQTYGPHSNEQNGQLFLAKYYAYRGLFSEAAKLYKKNKVEYLAVEMFNDLQMYEQANDYQTTEDRTEESTIVEQVAKTKLTNQQGSLGDVGTMSQLYISNGEYSKAFQLIINTNVERWAIRVSTSEYSQ